MKRQRPGWSDLALGGNEAFDRAISDSVDDHERALTDSVSFAGGDVNEKN
jgi:hypothetical protein